MSGPLPDNALQAWLQDETHNEFITADAIATMYGYFGSGESDPIKKLKEDDQNHCFLIFAEDEWKEVTCSVLHHLAQFPSRLGAQPTLYDGEWFLTSNQPVGGNLIHYLLPEDLFTEVNPAQCYNPNRIQREVTNRPDATHLTYVVNDANLEDLEAITTRRGMWIPNQYAHLCLGDRLSPVEVWNRLYGTILQNGHLEACKVLLQFLQYQLQGSATANQAVYNEGEDLVQPRANTVFLRHRNMVLSHLRPSVADPASTGGTPAASNVPAGGISAAQLQALIAALRAGHAAPAPAPTSSTTVNTVEKRWAVNLDVLLKLCMVPDVASLNPIWEALAKGPRKEERNILQSALDNRAASAGSATKAKLVVSKELHTTVVSLSFWSGDMDMLEEGLHPFRTMYTSAAKQAQDLARLRTYDALAREGTLRLEDIELFQVVLKSHWPTDFLQLDTSMKFFQNLLMVLLPSTHPLVISYTNFLGAWNDLHIPMAEYFAQDHSRPALFLRSLQLRIAAYWQRVTQSTAQAATAVPAPDFQALLGSLLVQSWVHPTMPGTIMRPLLETGGVPGHGAPSFTPPSHLLHAPAPGPAPAPSPAPAPVPSPAPAQRQTEVKNPNVDSQIAAAMEGRTFRIASLFNREVRPPRHDDGREVCCAYHWRGKCSSGCSRKASHGPLTEAERVRNLDFLQKHVLDPNIGRSGPAASS